MAYGSDDHFRELYNRIDELEKTLELYKAENAKLKRWKENAIKLIANE